MRIQVGMARSYAKGNTLLGREDRRESIVNDQIMVVVVVVVVTSIYWW